MNERTYEIKPCPFCGDEGRLKHERFLNDDFWCVMCVGCRTRTQSIISQRLAVKVWNNRVEKPATKQSFLEILIGLAAHRDLTGYKFFMVPPSDRWVRAPREDSNDVTFALKRLTFNNGYLWYAVDVERRIVYTTEFFTQEG